MAERQINQDGNAFAALGNSDLSDECIVLLEELVRSNRALASENEKLRQQHEQSIRANAEVLQRIENRMERDTDNSGAIRRRQNGSKRSHKGTVTVPRSPG